VSQQEQQLSHLQQQQQQRTQVQRQQRGKHSVLDPLLLCCWDGLRRCSETAQVLPQVDRLVTAGVGAICGHGRGSTDCQRQLALACFQIHIWLSDRQAVQQAEWQERDAAAAAAV